MYMYVYRVTGVDSSNKAIALAHHNILLNTTSCDNTNVPPPHFLEEDVETFLNRIIDHNRQVLQGSSRNNTNSISDDTIVNSVHDSTSSSSNNNNGCDIDTALKEGKPIYFDVIICDPPKLAPIFI